IAYLNRIRSPGQPAWQRYDLLGTETGSNPLDPWDPSFHDTLNFALYDTVADMDGDGRADIVHMHDQFEVRLNKPDGWHDAPQYSITAATTKPATDFHLFDINRDGLPDLVDNDEALALIDAGGPAELDGTFWYPSPAGVNSNPGAKQNRLMA